MSGESPPNMPGRFTGLSNNNKKYPGTPKSPLLSNNGGNRNAQARARFISGKLSAPLPINLPSLRREHAVGTEIPAAGSPSAPNHGWGSSSSPFTSPKQSEIKPEEVASETTKKMDDQHSESISDEHKSPTSPTLTEETATVRAWAAPATVQHDIKPPSSEFPTAAEAVAGKSNEKNEELDEDDKDYLRFIMSDPNHKSWDEMVAEDFEDDFTETMEFDELNQQQNQVVSPSERFTEDYDRSYPPQLKQTRDNDNYKHFRRNDDNYRYNYDGNHSNNSRRYSSSEGGGGGGGGGNERRHSNDRWNNNSSNHRRDSIEHKNTQWQRRPSYDRKTPYQPTLLQRNRRMSEQSARSDHSREDHALPPPPLSASSEQNPLQIIPEPDVPEDSPAEITAVQREVMMTAAERAKKRRDEEEAEYEAARERARQKAAALALKTKPEEVSTVETKDTDKETIKPDAPSSAPPPPPPPPKDDEKNPAPSSSSAVGDVSKPWNLVAAKKDQAEKPAKPSTPEDEPKLSESSTTNTSSSKASTSLTEDEQNWEKHVNEIRRNSLDSKPGKVVTANDWTQYAGRLQEKSSTKSTHKKSTDSSVQVEVIDFQKNKSWGEIPSNITRGRGRRNEGWVMTDEEDHSRASHGRGRGRKTSNPSTQQRRKLSDATDSWRQHPVKEPVVLEILKHSRPSSPVATIPEKEPECPKQMSASKISNLLHESSSPIFPSSIERLVGKKPCNISFMIDTEESDEEITMSHTTTTSSLQKSDTIQDEHVAEPSEGEDAKIITDNTTTPSDSGESSPSTSPAVSHGQKMEGSEMKRMGGNANFPVLIYQFPPSAVQGGDGSSPPLHGYVTRPDGNQQRPAGIYLSPPHQYVPGNQYMVPYPQAGTGNVQPIYFPTVSWQQQHLQQQRYNVHPTSNRNYYDRSNNNRPPYRSNRHNDDEWKYPSTTDGYSGRGTYRKRGHYSTSRGRGHSSSSSSSFYKKNAEFDQPSSTAVQDP